MHETYLLVQARILSSTGPGQDAARPTSSLLTALMLIFMSTRYLLWTNWTDSADTVLYCTVLYCAVRVQYSKYSADTGVILSNATCNTSRAMHQRIWLQYWEFYADIPPENFDFFYVPQFWAKISFSRLF